MTIAENVRAVKEGLADAARRAGRSPEEITLLAAVKTQPADKIREAIRAGVTAVGENRVQELLQKTDAYEGAALHFIGTLQKNKVKYVTGRVSLIHSIDSETLAKAVSDCAEARGIRQDVLLQVNIGYESSKGGIPPEDLETAVLALVKYPGIALRGLMCIPPNPEKGEPPLVFFQKMRQFYVDIRTNIMDNRLNVPLENFSILSMGMSGDYLEAAAAGSTLVRVGSAIFGSRA